MTKEGEFSSSGVLIKRTGSGDITVSDEAFAQLTVLNDLTNSITDMLRRLKK